MSRMKPDSMIPRFMEIVGEAVVTVELIRPKWRQAFYWTAFCYGALYHQSIVGSDVPAKVVVRNLNTGEVVYGDGPYFELEGESAARDVCKAIQSLGLMAYLEGRSITA